jgi:resuscitation-promoting factor RpfB
MLRTYWLSLVFLLFLCACQAAQPSFTILADGNIHYIIGTNERTPAQLIAKAGLTLGDRDCVLVLGRPVALDEPLPGNDPSPITVRRSVPLTLVLPDGKKTIQTCAQTVGEALTEEGYSLYSADVLDPPADTFIQSPLTVTYQQSQLLTVTVDGDQILIRSAASSVGQALAQAGLPLVGLDISIPPEISPLPEDGSIRITRISESVAITQKSLPFSTRTEPSADLEIDQQALLQGGEPGLAVSRIRTRTEDGLQVSQTTESESIVRPPRDRILGYGTKIVIRTATVDGETIQYYRVLTLAATSYSPCRSATPDGKCSYGTSSGLPVQRGTVAMVYSWYLAFGFDRLYIPGYGYATVGDVGAGPAGSNYWIDLGFTDEEYQPISGTVTVYFLAPVPKNLVAVLP